MICNRLLRIQGEIDKLDVKEHKILVGEKKEKGLKNECKKLNRIFEEILDDLEDDTQDTEGSLMTNKTLQRQLRNIFKQVNIDNKVNDLMVANHDKFMKNLSDLINNGLEVLENGWSDDFLKKGGNDKIDKNNLKGKLLTEFSEFSLGKRNKKIKGDHPVLQFVADFKKAIEEKKIVIKASLPQKTIFKMYTQS